MASLEEVNQLIGEESVPQEYGGKLQFGCKDYKDILFDWEAEYGHYDQVCVN